MIGIRPFKIVKKDNPTDDLCRLVLEPADGEPVFSFQAGQFVMVRESNDSGTATYPRAFSIASAPCESASQIELGIKSQGSLSLTLCESSRGDKFNIQGPYGTFTLDKTSDHLVFFAGGVGMTPFRSHVRESLLTELNQQIVLFYSGQNAGDLMYHAEFSELASKYPNFKYIPITTRECAKDWPGECQRLNQEMFDKYVADSSLWDYMMCGPQAMMDNVREMLLARDVDVEARLRFERY
ncbi:MAG: FAD-binding oxidoreductase [Patescibacteria group bacterium]|jgi:ferredoxin-NADP reductase